MTLFGLLSCLLSAGSAQQNPSAEVGYPYIRNFGRTDFKAPERTCDTIRDKRGIIQVGNEAGALEFDGVSWKLIPTPKNTYVRTFAKDPTTGRIYVGSPGDFGYPDDPKKTGKLEFVSLPDQAGEKKDRDFTDIRSTIPSGLPCRGNERGRSGTAGSVVEAGRDHSEFRTLVQRRRSCRVCDSRTDWRCPVSDLPVD